MSSARRADVDAIRALVDRQVEGWDAGDPDAYASVFTTDADYVTFLGSHYMGREAIVASYVRLFQRLLKGSHLDIEIMRLRFLTPDVALIHTTATVLKGARRRNGRNTRANTGALCEPTAGGCLPPRRTPRTAGSPKSLWQSSFHDDAGSPAVKIRMASPDDAGAIADVYLPYVRDTAISFETVPPSAEEIRSRLTTTLPLLPWLVITDRERVKGFAYASPHRARDAYRWSADVSLYLDGSIHRRGHGRRLYSALLNLIGAQGYIHAYAAIALPNPVSVGLHEALGFARVGVFHAVGFKNGTWWDVGWWHRRLTDLPARPRQPRPWSELTAHSINTTLEADTG